ncbi:hypothetical protein FRC12_016316 [Ceratobasidium sp. 428]|nr:hypothetical protein FRC12_016316 [Ceratobasidium sp. 428]
MSFGGSLISSANELSGSSSNTRIQGPHMLNLPMWESLLKYLMRPSPPAGSTAEWYRNQPTKKFTCIQHRKERTGPFFHKFIVIELNNDTVCRFDRRGDPATRANAFTTEGMAAEDTAHVIQKHESYYDEIYNTSDVLLQINLPESEDIHIILIACHGLQLLKSTQAYSLLEHNCYFFSWMILATVVHYTTTVCRGNYGASFALPESETIKKPSLGDRILDKASATFTAWTTGSFRQPSYQSTPTLTITLPRGDSDIEVADAYHYIKSRIRGHCKHLRKFGIRLDPGSFEGTMRDSFEMSLTGPSYTLGRSRFYYFAG